MTIEALLQAIRPDAPCGDDLSFSPEFDAIAEMRREDDPSLAQGEWVTDLKVADWPGVLKATDTLLRTRSKDLRVAAWWADAAARVNGLPGLADGLLLCARLVQDHWKHVYPLPDGGDMEERIGSITWLLQRVGDLARLAPVLSIGRRRFGLRDVEAARSRGNQTGEDTGAEPPPTLDAMQRALAQGGHQAFDALLSAAHGAQTALTELQTQVDARLGMDGPGFSAARKALSDCADAVKRLGRDSGLGGSEPPSDDATPPGHLDLEAANGASAASPVPAPVLRGTLQNRAQALQQLRDVAAFFRRTEPHSPVAYLAEKAARWGDLPLHAWLRQVVKDGGALSQLDELLGVEPPSEH